MTSSPAHTLFVSAFLLVLALASGACQSQLGAKRTGHAGKPQTQKIDLGLLRLQHRVCGAGLSLAQAAAAQGFKMTDQGLVLDIVTSRLDDNAREAFQMPGVALRHVSRKYRRVSAAIADPRVLDELAAIPEVRSISPEYGAIDRTSPSD